MSDDENDQELNDNEGDDNTANATFPPSNDDNDGATPIDESGDGNAASSSDGSGGSGGSGGDGGDEEEDQSERGAATVIKLVVQDTDCSLDHPITVPIDADVEHLQNEYKQFSRREIRPGATWQFGDRALIPSDRLQALGVTDDATIVFKNAPFEVEIRERENKDARQNAAAVKITVYYPSLYLSLVHVTQTCQ
jgi:hypothetical protein